MFPKTVCGRGLPVTVIAAVAQNGVIGSDGKIPWDISEDLDHFRCETVGNPVIMGRRTFEGIVDKTGEPLPDRKNIVLSNSDPDLADDVFVASSIEAAFQEAVTMFTLDSPADAVYVCGGQTVYEQLLPYADRLVITEVHQSYDGDTYFPEWEEGDWVEIARKESDVCDFVYYEFEEATWLEQSDEVDIQYLC